MATITYIPNPASVNVRTAGYTIPADRYARAVVNLEGSATFTINGTTALRGTQNSVLGSSPIQYAVLFNAGAGRNENVQITTGFSNSSFTIGSVFASATDQKTVVQDLFLPPGTVINGTGTWRAVVEEYFN